MDDPRQILSEAGVECPEVEEWARVDAMLPSDGRGLYPESCTAAILALARLVAKYKGRCDSVYDEGHQTGYQKGTLDAEGKYEPLIAKYKWQRDAWMRENSSEYATERYWSEEVADLDRRWEERDADV